MRKVNLFNKTSFVPKILFGIFFLSLFLSYSVGASKSNEILLAAGDIADCSVGAVQTAKLLETQSGTILALGDLAYPKGSSADFKRCFLPTWGKYLGRMLAVPGNHDYMTAGGQPYFAELRNGAGPSKQGYYSVDKGGWHLVALNTELGPSKQAG